MKKTWIKGLMACSLSALVLAGCGSNNGEGKSADGDSSNGKQQKLVISTWGFAEDFYNKEVYAPFEKAHNVKIVLETGNNADRLSKIMQGSSDVDVIYLSDYYAQQGIEAGAFEKIDRSHLKNLDHIYDIAKAPNGEDYGPAYTVGQLGIAYDPKAAGTKIESWSDLWKPELKGKLTMPSITSTSGPMMVDAASKTAGSADFNEDKAFEKLTALNPSVVKYYSKTSEFVNMFTQGEAAAGPIMQMYLSDLQKADPGIEFVTPKEGAYSIINTLNVVKGSKNKELAEEFIDWQLSQEVQEKAAKAKVDSPANKDVKLTDEEAKGVTYGADVVEKLQKLDMAFVNSQLKTWTDRFNREVTR
ncbi:ABC transporter substrate-binding protein [Paenibacillus azoreducens]|uniref:Spermidine/putrescine ABC transporter n=2 Tax=Paenibacillus azoreducens TaxID=116718 RepID=A0A919YAT6_9BACL|nr:spermidine/putrescine ABC transporter [Paenibacillus azoreducens]